MLTLGKMKKGQCGYVVGFSKDADKSYRAKLLALGITPRAHVCVKRIAPLGDPLQISVRGSQISLRKAEADVVKVDIS